MSYKEATLLSHLGMGDLILMSGAAVYLARAYDKFYFPCRSDQLTSDASFFSQHPEIEVYIVEEINGACVFLPKYMKGTILSPGLLIPAPRPKAVSFAEHCYRQLGVPYSERWDSCPIAEAVKSVPQLPLPELPYAFVHDDRSRGIAIKSEHISVFPIVRPDPSGAKNILAYAEQMTHAWEGHYIDSSFRHLAESIPTRGRLFYHEYARSDSPIKGEPDAASRKDWVVFS